jgi:hypothetical protein
MPPADWKDGDDINPGEARKAVRAMLDSPSHKRPKGHPDDERTKDDALDDPKHNEGEE